MPSKHDLAAGFSYTCAVLGIGSLAMGRNFGRSGIYYSSFALLMMYAINLFCTIGLSIVLNHTPRDIVTFSDLGGYVCGKYGKYAVMISQLGACLVLPIAFLVLGGGTILPIIFKHVFENGGLPNVYIPLMAMVLLPVVLIKSLKEAAWVTYLGTFGAVFGILFAVMDSILHSNYYDNAMPKYEPSTVLSVFGSMTMAFGGAIVLPNIQREHPKPENMPMIVFVVLTIISIIYFCIGWQGYVQYGCVAPGNLLLSMTSRRLEIAAMILFLMHIVLAFPVYLNPALYMFERSVLGFHIEQPSILKHYHTNDVVDAFVVDNALYTTFPIKERIRSYILRTSVVAVQVFLAMLLQGSFEDVADVVGSTLQMTSSILIPLVLYATFFKSISKFQKICIAVVFTIALCLGIYTSIGYTKNIIMQSKHYRLFYSTPKVSAAYAHVSDIDTSFCYTQPKVIQ